MTSTTTRAPAPFPAWSSTVYDAPLFFANAQDFRCRALAAARRDGAARWFVLNVEANVEVDFTALEALDQVRDELAQDGTIFALARVKQDLLVRLKAFGLTAKIGPGLLFPTLPTAVAAYRDWTARQPPQAGQNPDSTGPSRRPPARGPEGPGPTPT